MISAPDICLPASGWLATESAAGLWLTTDSEKKLQLARSAYLQPTSSARWHLTRVRSRALRQRARPVCFSALFAVSSLAMTPRKRHIVSILLQNEVGALTRVASLWCTRGYNLESLN